MLWYNIFYFACFYFLPLSGFSTGKSFKMSFGWEDYMFVHLSVCLILFGLSASFTQPPGPSIENVSLMPCKSYCHSNKKMGLQKCHLFLSTFCGYVIKIENVANLHFCGEV